MVIGGGVTTTMLESDRPARRAVDTGQYSHWIVLTVAVPQPTHFPSAETASGHKDAHVSANRLGRCR